MFAGIFKIIITKYTYTEHINPSIFRITSSESFLNKDLPTWLYNFLAYLTKLLWIISKQIAHLLLWNLEHWKEIGENQHSVLPGDLWEWYYSTEHSIPQSQECLMTVNVLKIHSLSKTCRLTLPNRVMLWYQIVSNTLTTSVSFEQL